MSRAIDWFAENRVAANILMVLIVAGGLLSLPVIKKEIFPSLALDIINVTVPYPGATPEDVEQSVCVRIEEAVQGLEGIERLTSVAVEGACTVSIETRRGYDTRALLDDVKSRIDGIETFPEESEEPIVREVIETNQVLNVAVSGDVSERTLKSLAEQVRDEIAAITGITVVEVAAVRAYEVSIEVAPAALRRYGMTFNEVANAVRGASIDLPGGAVETAGGEVLLRTSSQAYRAEDFERIAVRTLPDGSRLRIGDVATVNDAFVDTDQAARFDGRPTALVQVYRVGEQSVLSIADKVRAYIAQAQQRMPPGISLTVWQDNSEYFRSRMNLLIKNGLTGLLLVFAVLALFLKFRLAFWVSLGIPVSFLGTMLVMTPLDVSLNMLSLFAFILVLGIVVDDAIVVGEDVHTHQSRGMYGLAGARRGANEVAIPVIFAVLTTVVAFSPLLFVPGVSGKIWRVIPLIVIPTLLFSLLESLFILPAHLSHVGAGRGRLGAHPAFAWWPRFQARFANGLQWFIHSVYRPSLERILLWRYLTIASGIAALALVGALLAGGWIKTVFLPNVEADFVVAVVTMPLGTPIETTREVAQRLERSAAELRRQVDAQRASGSVFRHMLTSIGEQPFTNQARGPGDRSSSASGSHLAEIMIELAPSAERGISSEVIADRWRALTGPIPGTSELTFTSSLFSAGEALNVQLSGSDLAVLRRAAESLKSRLREYSGVYDVADSYRSGKEELAIRIKPGAQHLGLTQAELARQVRQAFYGEEAQRVQRGRHDVRVMVRYPETRRRSIGDVETLPIRTPQGGEVPLHSVATVEYGRGFATITRVDRRRAVNVTADVDASQANATAILESLTETYLPRLVAEHPGLRWEIAGEQEEQRESMQSLMRGFLYAMLGIYALMAIPFKSYVQPLIVLSVVPFGLIGAVLGHLMLGLDISVLSMAGMVALAGVVVNDSLVLTDFVNRARRRGESVFDAVRQAGVARFRPVLLTSLTTFAGLTPLLLETSLQAQFLIPMAVSLAFGVMFATVITLAIVPCGYLVVEDVKRLVRRDRSIAQEQREVHADGASEPVIGDGSPARRR